MTYPPRIVRLAPATPLIIAVVLLTASALLLPPPQLAAGAAQADKENAKDQDKEAKSKATFEVYQDKAGAYRWRLRAQNTKVLATASEGYKEKRSCLAAIESVKRVVPDAPVVERSAADDTAPSGDVADPAPKDAPRK